MNEKAAKLIRRHTSRITDPQARLEAARMLRLAWLGATHRERGHQLRPYLSR